MTKTELKQAHFTQGIESAHLDGLVHDAASQMASAANNDGVDSQLDFLLDTAGWTAEMILTSTSR